MPSIIGIRMLERDQIKKVFGKHGIAEHNINANLHVLTNSGDDVKVQSAIVWVNETTLFLLNTSGFKQTKALAKAAFWAVSLLTLDMNPQVRQRIARNMASAKVFINLEDQT